MSILDLLSQNEAKRRAALNAVLDKTTPVVLGITSPFRKGANILAQNYASAFTGKDMSNPENQGAFLKYLASSITPDEQTQINDHPYLEDFIKQKGSGSTLFRNADSDALKQILETYKKTGHIK